MAARCIAPAHGVPCFRGVSPIHAATGAVDAVRTVGRSGNRVRRVKASFREGPSQRWQRRSVTSVQPLPVAVTGSEQLGSALGTRRNALRAIAYARSLRSMKANVRTMKKEAGEWVIESRRPNHRFAALPCIGRAERFPILKRVLSGCESVERRAHGLLSADSMAHPQYSAPRRQHLWGPRTQKTHR